MISEIKIHAIAATRIKETTSENIPGIGNPADNHGVLGRLTRGSDNTLRAKFDDHDNDGWREAWF